MSRQSGGEVRLIGAEATAAWRRVRGTFYGTFVGYGLVMLAAWLLWRPSSDQLRWIALGVTAVAVAVFWGRHNIMSWTYVTSTIDGQRTAEFVSRPPPVPSVYAVPILLLAALFAFLAATPTGLGKRLAIVFSALETIYSAVEAVGFFLFLPLMAIFGAIITVAVIGFGLLSVFEGLYSLAGFALRGFRRNADGEIGGAQFLVGMALLAFVALIALSIWHGWDEVFDELLNPYRTIRSWF